MGFINNNSRGDYLILDDGKIESKNFNHETQLDEILKNLNEEQKNIIMTVGDLKNVEKDSPVVAYIDDPGKSEILIIDYTYFVENKSVTKESDGEKN